MILVTGSAGLLGRHLCARLTAANIPFRGFDTRSDPREDIRIVSSLELALQGVIGVVHLASVSRVVWCERDPQGCFATNVAALRNLVQLCAAGSHPWIIFASSREVYGNAAALPVREDAPLHPINVYARSKRDGEGMVMAAREEGLLTNICRFSNVFGCTDDHPDRVVMAFAKVAALGGTMSIEGGSNMFDFTAVEDAVDGLFRLIEATMRNERLEPIHFVSGQGTTLQQLADIAAFHARATINMIETPPRDFDVKAFRGDPSRAATVLGWKSHADLSERVARLIADLAVETQESDVRALPSGFAAR